MTSEVIIKLSRNDVGQLLEGIDVLIEQWQATADFLADGRVREDVCIRESSSPHEASSIAAIYEKLRATITAQLPHP